MAELKLNYIICNDTQEWPQDELYLKLDGRTVWDQGGWLESSVGVGDVFAIDKSFTITGTSDRLSLYEDDAWPNGDEFLGGTTIYASQAGSGEQFASFTREGANYQLSYEVLA